MLIAIGEMTKKHGLRCVNVFHAGDGNLHPLILFDANDADRAAPRRGLRRRDPRDSASRWAARSPASTASASRSCRLDVRAVLAGRARADVAVKRAFDPAGLLNPGKVIPTLVRCAEYGKMHVKRGLLRVPRAAAVLSGRGRPRAARIRPSAALAERIARCQRVAHGRSASAAAAPRTSTARRRAASCSTLRALDGAADARADRARRHRARRHALVDARSAARRARPVPAVRAAALRRRLDRRRHGRGRPLGAVARRAPARCATTCSASTLLSGTRRAAALRRPRHQERRRLRRLAPRRRLARHPRRDRRGLAQGAAEGRAPRRRCAST